MLRSPPPSSCYFGGPYCGSRVVIANTSLEMTAPGVPWAVALDRNGDYLSLAAASRCDDAGQILLLPLDAHELYEWNGDAGRYEYRGTWTREGRLGRLV